METFFVVVVGNSILNIDIVEITCTCHRWQISSISCEHAFTVILFIGQNSADFIDNMLKLPAQQLVYSSIFHDIETHDMLKVDDNGVVRDVIGNVFFSLKPPCIKRPVGRSRKKHI